MSSEGWNLCILKKTKAKHTSRILIHYLLKCKTRVFLEIWHLNMWSHLKFVQEAPNQITLNWTMKSQTKACITQLSCKICTLLRYYTTYSGNSLLMLQYNLSVPSSRVKNSKRRQNSKRQNRSWQKLTDSSFLEAGCSRFQAKKHLSWWTTQNELFSTTGHHRTTILLLYVPVNTSRPRVVLGR
jgi:hypothetical protein